MVTMLLTACFDKQSTTDTQANASSSDSVAAETQVDSQETGEGYDPYAVENRYNIGSEMFEKQSGVDYGTLLKDYLIIRRLPVITSKSISLYRQAMTRIKPIL